MLEKIENRLKDVIFFLTYLTEKSIICSQGLWERVVGSEKWYTPEVHQLREKRIGTATGTLAKGMHLASWINRG